MKTSIRFLSACLLLSAAFSCDKPFNVHEWPEVSESDTETVIITLDYDTDMTEWDHTYDGSSVTEVGTGDTYDNSQTSGSMRYIVRAYPLTAGKVSETSYQEFVFTKDIASGYDNQVSIAISPGDYNIMVWSDQVESGSGWLYDASDFSEIVLDSDQHYGNEDYRDAFRGEGTISFDLSYEEHDPYTMTISMYRPLAKFEFISKDLEEFITKQQARLEEKQNSSGDSGSTDTKVSVDDFTVMFSYMGFMPDTYSMFTDKAVDSATEVTFTSSISQLSDTEASLGFDYVIIGEETYVTMTIYIYSNGGTEPLSTTSNVRVPLKRSYHTIVSGEFLTSEASGGISVNPDYDGEYNVYYE